MGRDGCAGGKYLDGGRRRSKSQQWWRQLQLYLPKLEWRWGDQGQFSEFHQRAECLAGGTDVQPRWRRFISEFAFCECLSDSQRSSRVSMERGIRRARDEYGGECWRG